MIEQVKKIVTFTYKVLKFLVLFPWSLILMSTIKGRLFFNFFGMWNFTKVVSNGKYSELKNCFNSLPDTLQTSSNFNVLSSKPEVLSDLTSILVELEKFPDLWDTTEQSQKNLNTLIKHSSRIILLQQIFKVLQKTNLFNSSTVGQAQSNFNAIVFRDLDAELLSIFQSLAHTSVLKKASNQQEILQLLLGLKKDDLGQVAKIMSWAKDSEIFRGDKALQNFKTLFEYNDNNRLLADAVESLEESKLLLTEKKHGVEYSAQDYFTFLVNYMIEVEAEADIEDYQDGSSYRPLEKVKYKVEIELATHISALFSKLKTTTAFTTEKNAFEAFIKADSLIKTGSLPLLTAIISLIDLLNIDSLFINNNDEIDGVNNLFSILDIRDSARPAMLKLIFGKLKDTEILTGKLRQSNYSKIMALNGSANIYGAVSIILSELKNRSYLNQESFDLIFEALHSSENVAQSLKKLKQDDQIEKYLSLDYIKRNFKALVDSGKYNEQFISAIQELLDTSLLTDHNSNNVINALVAAGNKAVEVAKSFKHLIGTGLLEDDSTYSSILEVKDYKKDDQSNLQVANQILEFLSKHSIKLLNSVNLPRLLQLNKNNAQSVLEALQFFKGRQDLLDQISFDLLLASPASSVIVARLLTYSKRRETPERLNEIVQKLGAEQLGDRYQEFQQMARELTEEQAQVIHKLVANLAGAHALTFNILATLLSYKDEKDANGKLLLATLLEAVALIDIAEGEFTFAPLLSQEFAKYPALLAIALKFHLYSKITDADIAIRKGSSVELLEPSKKEEVEKLVQQGVQYQFEQITRYQISANPNESTEQIHDRLAAICMDKLDKDYAICPKSTVVAEVDSSSKDILGTYQLLMRVLHENTSSPMHTVHTVTGLDSTNPQSVALITASLYKALGSINRTVRNLTVDFDNEEQRRALSTAAPAG